MFTDESEIKAVVDGFENCTTDKADFTHADHLTVATWYLSTNSIDQAVDIMRSSLFRFIEHHGVNRRKYHETLTVFWIKLIAETLKRETQLATLVDKCNLVLRDLGDKNVCYQFYSKDLLNSESARETFVEPDLKTLGS